MRRFIFVPLVVLAISAPLLAAATQKATHPQSWSSSGTVERFDADTNTLVVKEGNTIVPFVLSPTTSITSGKQTLHSADLNGAAGRHVKVKYMMAGPTRTANAVDIAPAAMSARK